MIVITSALIGLVLGGVTAKRRGGNRLDIAQYAGAYAIAFALLGVFASIALEYALS